MAYLDLSELRASSILTKAEADGTDLVKLETRARVNYIDAEAHQSFIAEDLSQVTVGWDLRDDIWLGKRIRDLIKFEILTTGKTETEELNIEDFTLGEYSLHLQRGYRFKRWIDTGFPVQVRVTGDYGWTSVPERVKEATLLACENLVLIESNRGAESDPFKNLKIGDYAYTLKDSAENTVLIPRIRSLLSPYIMRQYVSVL